MEEETTQQEPVYETIDIASYKLMDQAEVAQIEVCPDPPENFSDCIMIMLIGLPGSGKTSFAQRFAERNYKRNYQMLGAFEVYEHIISTVRIPLLKQNILTLMEISNDIFQKSLILASRTKRNFIIDQCNVFLQSRLEKLALFKEFHKDAYVIVLTEFEYSKRLSKKQRYLSSTGHFYPRICMENVRYLKEHFVLPGPNEFDSVKYLALDEERARQAVMLSSKLAKSQVHPLLRKKKYKRVIEIARAKKSPQKNLSLYPKDPMPVEITTAAPFEIQNALEKKKAMKAALYRDQHQFEGNPATENQPLGTQYNTTIFQSPPVIKSASSLNNAISPHGANIIANSPNTKLTNQSWDNQNNAALNFTNYINSISARQTFPSQGGNAKKESETTAVSQEKARLMEQYELLKSQLQAATISFKDPSQSK